MANHPSREENRRHRAGGRHGREGSTQPFQGGVMKDGLRFVDCDMHIMEPPDLFEKYLEPKFRSRVSLPIGADGRPQAPTAPSRSRDPGSPTRGVSISPSSASTTRWRRSWAWGSRAWISPSS